MTGRKQLDSRSVEVKVTEIDGKKLVSMTIPSRKPFKNMPDSARIKLRLFENKFSETLEFGTLGEQESAAEIRSGAFSAPSCQLRVVAGCDTHRGRILASTKTWTLRIGGDDGRGTTDEGILLFQSHDIAPRSWKLELREDDYPIVYVDRRIPNSRTWVRNDPVFRYCVLPAIIREVFEDILSVNDPPDQGWMKDWLDWADALMSGGRPPWTDGRQQKQDWIANLIDSFCQRHGMLESLVGELERNFTA